MGALVLYILVYGYADRGSGLAWTDSCYTMSKDVAEKWVAQEPAYRKYRTVKLYNGEGL